MVVITILYCIITEYANTCAGIEKKIFAGIESKVTFLQMSIYFSEKFVS